MPGCHQVRVAPLLSSVPGLRHFGSWSSVWVVSPRRRRIVTPYALEALVESFPPGARP